MKLIKRLLVFLFGTNVDTYPFKVLELDYDDMMIQFNDGNLDYILDLEWESGIMDVEFGVMDSKIHDTTNTYNHYKILNTVSYITRRMSDNISYNTGMVFHTVTFKSSNWRNGEVNAKSEEIRNKLFMRYILRQFPNAEIEPNKYDLLTIKLNRI